MKTGVEKLTDVMAHFLGHTAIRLPDDVIAKLEELRDKEDHPLAKVIYRTMFRNQMLAEKLQRPSCQDTGVPQYWVRCGTAFPYINELEDLLREAATFIPHSRRAFIHNQKGRYALRAPPHFPKGVFP